MDEKERIRVLARERIAIEAMMVAADILNKAVSKVKPRTFDIFEEYQALKKAHRELLDRAHVYGIWGPWADGWEGSYDQRHWGEE